MPGRDYCYLRFVLDVMLVIRTCIPRDGFTLDVKEIRPHLARCIGCSDYVEG